MNYLAPFLVILLAVPGERTGALRIRSQPGVEVLWEGVALGKTDAEGLLVVEDIPAGDYLLTLRAPGFHQVDVRTTVAARGEAILELPLSSTGALGDQPPSPGLAAEVSTAPTIGTTTFLWLAVGLLLALVGWRILLPRLREGGASQPEPEPPWLQPTADEPELSTSEPVPPTTGRGSPTFLEDLKRREQNLGEVVVGSQQPEETIIEVEAVEVVREDR